MRAGVGLGRHLIIEMYDCDPIVLDSIDVLKNALVEAAKATNSKVLWHKFHKFYPQGVTGVVIVAESHLSIHTWPEFGYAAIDIFTCGTHTNPWKALEVLKSVLKPKRMSVLEIKRGILTFEEEVEVSDKSAKTLYSVQSP